MNKEAEYIYINRAEGNCRKISLTAEDDCGTCWLNVQQVVKEGVKELKHRQNKQLARKIKKYCGEQTVILGNEKAVMELELPNRLFYMRKQELIHNVRDVFRYFQARTGCDLSALADRKKRVEEQDLRSRFLLVLESMEWTHKEVTEILWAVKDFYEDIYIVLDDTVIDQDRLQDYFCEECGIVLHVIEEDVARKLSVEGAFFLLKHWNVLYKEYKFRMGYVVSEWERDMVRRRKALRKIVETHESVACKELYAGFVYECEKRQMAYEKAIASIFHMEGLLKEEKPISIVAIYGVE